MSTPTAEVEAPTDLVWRLLAGQRLPHEELTEGDGPFHPLNRRQVRGRFTNRLRPGEAVRPSSAAQACTTPVTETARA